MSSEEEHEAHIEQWKIKRLIKALEAARGNGTSMISLILPPRDQVSRVQKMLADEYGTASNIKNRVNRWVVRVVFVWRTRIGSWRGGEFCLVDGLVGWVGWWLGGLVGGWVVGWLGGGGGGRDSGVHVLSVALRWVWLRSAWLASQTIRFSGHHFGSATAQAVQ